MHPLLVTAHHRIESGSQQPFLFSVELQKEERPAADSWQLDVPDLIQPVGKEASFPVELLENWFFFGRDRLGGDTKNSLALILTTLIASTKSALLVSLLVSLLSTLLTA
jgi:hypothetical protein